MSKRASKKKQRSDLASPPSHPLLQRMGLISIAVLHFVCPLLMFTNLTRNPYYTQIALLNLGIAVCGLIWAMSVWQKNEWTLPRVSFEGPLLAFLGVALVTTVLSWVDHEFVRPGIFYEGVRLWSFTLVNSVLALYLPLVFIKPLEQGTKKMSIWTDIIFSCVWGGLWFGFHSMRDPNSAATLWDPYGGFLWGLGLLFALYRLKDGEALGVFHLIFVVCFLSGVYGVLQYSGRDLIWNSPIQPYGGRPVSTFGNPNFLSSYLLLVSPMAVAFALHSSKKQAWGYGLIAFVSVLSILCTLTRSTYVGLAACYAALAVFLFRRDQWAATKWIVIASGAILLVFVLFPSTPVLNIQSPLARFTEIFDAIESGEPYGPWHQRILIWSSAWDMVQERPLVGKGWGLFELFYPYYQGGHMLREVLNLFRTHANNAHNVLMEVWSQVGLLGTGTALWLMVVLFFGGWKIFRSKPEGLSRVLCASLLAGFVGMMTDNFFGNVSIFFAVPAFLFWWNMGSLYNESDRVKLIRRPLDPLWGRGLLVGFMIFCLGMGAYFFKRWNQEVYYFAGFKASKSNQVKKSIEDLETAYKWFKGEVNSNYELGNSYARYAKMLDDQGLKKQANDYKEKSLWAYGEAIRANPGYDEIFFNRGITYLQMKKFEEAERDLHVAIYINPLLRDGYASLSNLYIKQKKLDQAGDMLENGIETFPEDKDFLLNLGFIYTKLEQHEKAYDQYKKAYLLDPNFMQAWNNLRLAATTLKRDEPLLAVPNLIKQIEDSVKKQDYKTARDAAQKVVRFYPKLADAHLSLGNVLFYSKFTEAAIKSLKKAQELNPRLDAAYLNLGEVYRSLGQNESARAEYQKVLEYSPNNEEAKRLLGLVPPSPL